MKNEESRLGDNAVATIIAASLIGVFYCSAVNKENMVTPAKKISENVATITERAVEEGKIRNIEKELGIIIDTNGDGYGSREELLEGYLNLPKDYVKK